MIFRCTRRGEGEPAPLDRGGSRRRLYPRSFLLLPLLPLLPLLLSSLLFSSPLFCYYMSFFLNCVHTTCCLPLPCSTFSLGLLLPLFPSFSLPQSLGGEPWLSSELQRFFISGMWATSGSAKLNLKSFNHTSGYRPHHHHLLLLLIIIIIIILLLIALSFSRSECASMVRGRRHGMVCDGIGSSVILASIPLLISTLLTNSSLISPFLMIVLCFFVILLLLLLLHLHLLFFLFSLSRTEIVTTIEQYGSYVIFSTLFPKGANGTNSLDLGVYYGPPFPLPHLLIFLSS